MKILFSMELFLLASTPKAIDQYVEIQSANNNYYNVTKSDLACTNFINLFSKHEPTENKHLSEYEKKEGRELDLYHSTTNYAIVYKAKKDLDIYRCAKDLSILNLYLPIESSLNELKKDYYKIIYPFILAKSSKFLKNKQVINLFNIQQRDTFETFEILPPNTKKIFDQINSILENKDEHSDENDVFDILVNIKQAMLE